MALDLNLLLATGRSSGWDTIVHLGAGDGRDWLRAAPGLARRVVLVEGDAATAARLRAAARRHAHWEPLTAVVGSAHGEAPWYLHDLPGFDGLVRQDGGRYPRLRCRGETPVATQALASVLAQASRADQPAERCALLVDLPLQTLDGDAEALPPLLARFGRVIVTPAATGGRAETPLALAAGLDGAGFLRQQPRGRPACAVFGIDTTLRAAREAERRQVAALHAAERQRLADEHQAAQQAAAAAHAAERELAAAAHAAEREQTAAAHAAEREQTAAVHEAERRRSEAERRQCASTTMALEKALEQLRASRHRTAVDLAGAHERIRSLESALARMRALRDSTEQRQLELQQALQRADAALRGLGPLLRPPEEAGP